METSVIDKARSQMEQIDTIIVINKRNQSGYTSEKQWSKESELKH